MLQRSQCQRLQGPLTPACVGVQKEALFKFYHTFRCRKEWGREKWEREMWYPPASWWGHANSLEYQSWSTESVRVSWSAPHCPCTVLGQTGWKWSCCFTKSNLQRLMCDLVSQSHPKTAGGNLWPAALRVKCNLNRSISTLPWRNRTRASLPSLVSDDYYTIESFLAIKASWGHCDLVLYEKEI